MRIAALVLLALWVGSLLVPAVGGCAVGKPVSWTPGWEIGLVGFMGPLQLQFAWYANPAFIVLTIFLFLLGRANLLMIILAVLTLALGATAFTWQDILTDSPTTRLCWYGPGFWMWLLALFGLAAATIADRFPRKAR